MSLKVLLLATLTMADPASRVLLDATGKEHHPREIGDSKGVVLVFLLTDCPIANRYVPELQRIHEEYEPKGFRFFGILVDAKLSAESARKHAEDFAYPFPVLLDSDHQFAREVKATKTPEAFVFNSENELVYHGRIDDRWAKLGKSRFEPKRRDLRLTLDALLAGDTIEIPETNVVGCPIPFAKDDP